MIADAAFQAVLGLAAMLGLITTRNTRPAVRSYFRVAGIFYLALAISGEIGIFVSGAAAFAGTVMLVVCALGPALLAMSLFAAFEHPPKSWIAAILLVLAAIFSILSAIGGFPQLSFAPLMASVFAMLALSARRWRIESRGPLHAIVAALCFLAGAACDANEATGGRTALAMFSAAGLLGLSIALARRLRPLVAEQTGKDIRFAAISGGG